ncbi:MAG: hypothetical protein LUE08_08780, partial [Akkermansiaceae bacterium]|nr:hypothetical protein [Akkermansiaceae bacterium]
MFILPLRPFPGKSFVDFALALRQMVCPAGRNRKKRPRQSADNILIDFGEAFFAFFWRAGAVRR